jgi:hypothetical protein
VIREKVADSLGLTDADYQMRWNIYGKNGTLGPFETENLVDGHEVALLIDIVAKDQGTARSIGSVAWHTALHQPIPEYSGLVSHLAFPVSPPAIDAGPVYEFSVNHVMHVQKPSNAYTLTIEKL